jgi:hypothetical protein
LSSHLCQGFSSDLITRNCFNKILYAFLISHMLHILPISFSTSSPQNLMKSAKMKHHVQGSLFTGYFYVQIFSLTLCSRTSTFMFFLSDEKQSFRPIENKYNFWSEHFNI